MLPNGRVTGTVRGTKNDLMAPNATASRRDGDNEDHCRHYNEDEDDREDDDDS